MCVWLFRKEEAKDHPPSYNTLQTPKCLLRGLLLLRIFTRTPSWWWSPQRLVPFLLSFFVSLMCLVRRPTFWTKVYIFFLWSSSAWSICLISCTKFLFIWIIVVFYISGVFRVWRRFLWTMEEITTDGDQLFQWSERKRDQHRVWRSSSGLETDSCCWGEIVVL